MKKLRNCVSAQLNTGGSACGIDWGKVKGAILVEHGQKLPASLTAQTLAQSCHADRPARIYPIVGFVEYAKNGGEAQVSPIGYGPNQYNGMAAQTDTFTLPRFDEMLNAQLIRCANKDWDVYYFDSNKALIGYNDGTDVLAGIPMSAVYPGATQFSTSGAASSMTVNFCHMDAEDSQKNFDYVMLDFNPAQVIKGLTECSLVETSHSSKKFKIIENVGGYDRTPEFGTTFAAAVSSVMGGAASATYSEGTINVTGEGPLTVNAASALYAAEIKWIDITAIVEAQA